MHEISTHWLHELLLTTKAGYGLILILAYFLVRSVQTPKQRSPPGPKRKPVIGNLLDFPPPGTSQTAHWNEHRRLYGPISSLDVLRQKIIVINDSAVAKELLDKRATKWSERPIMTFAGEMCGFINGMIFAPANERFRDQRRIAHSQLGSLSSLQKWSSDIDVEVRRYLFRTLVKPEDLLQHVRKEAGSIILRVVYGYNVEPYGQDALVDLMEEVMQIFAKAAVPGDWLVDTLPLLRNLPSWLPGMSFKRTAALWHQKIVRTAYLPFEFTQRQVENGNAPTSLVSESIKRLKADPLSKASELITWAAVSMYAGGSDTTVTQMEWFFVAMIRFPEVQRKAQAEIDRFVGRHRLPEPSDRANLPYLEALLKECFRWGPIAEVLIPHTSNADDYYDDYFIPKGSMVLFNLAGCLSNPEVYHDPDEFKPERFLGDDPEPDPQELTWGYGRRTCPGRWLAVTNLWLQITRTLAVFDIKAVKGKEPTTECIYSLVRKPAPYEADIRVRSPEHEALIREILTISPFPDHGDGNLL